MNTNLVLVGNANTGKTTLFNAFTKQNQKTGNWHGVTNTVSKSNYTFNQTEFTLYDIPGIYSLTPLSFEEKVATDFVLNNPDYLYLNICEQNNIKRNLYLTLQLLELGVQTVLIINTKGQPLNINTKKIKQNLGVDILIYQNKNDVINIKNYIFNYQNKKLNKLNYIEKLLQKYDFELKNNKKTQKNDKNNTILLNYKNNKQKNKNKKVCKNCDKCNICFENINNFQTLNKDFIKIKLLEQDPNFLKYYDCQINQIENVCISRYNFIDTFISDSTTVYGTNKLDKILLNKFLALPIFMLVLLSVFYLTFFLIGPFISNLLTQFISSVGSSVLNILSAYLKSGWFYDLIDTAIIGGIGSVLAFLPQVSLLFMFLTILEDSGYLSRVAFLFEDILCKFGLSGKGVYTLLMGFGCSATSIMTARNMEDKNAKIKVALTTPYFSCSAKLPIYAVLGGAFFGAQNVFVIMGLYLLGVIVGLGLCAFMEKFLYKSKQQSFILEFAPLKLVKAKRIAKTTWDNVKQFLIRIGSLIICINVIVFVISSFSFTFQYVKMTGGESMLQSIGKFISPIFVPLGFGNWGSSSAILAGLIAKEIVISSISIFNNVTSNSLSLQSSLYNPSSPVFFTPYSAISFLVFCLLYTPCVTTLMVINKELGFKYFVLALFGQFAVAYGVSFLIYSVVTFNVVNLIVLLCLALSFVATILFIKILKTKKIKNISFFNFKNAKRHKNLTQNI